MVDSVEHAKEKAGRIVERLQVLQTTVPVVAQESLVAEAHQYRIVEPAQVALPDIAARESPQRYLFTNHHRFMRRLHQWSQVEARSASRFCHTFSKVLTTNLMSLDE